MSKQLKIKKKPHNRKASQNTTSVLGVSALPDIVESPKASDEAPVLRNERKTIDPSDSPTSHSSFQFLNEESPHKISPDEERKDSETPELIEGDLPSSQNPNENQYEGAREVLAENEKIENFTFQPNPQNELQSPSMNFVESRENQIGGNAMGQYTFENQSSEQPESITEDKFSILTEDSIKNSSMPPSIEGEVSSSESDNKSENLKQKVQEKIEIVQPIIVKENSPELLEDVFEVKKVLEVFANCKLQCEPNNLKILYNGIKSFQPKDSHTQDFKLALDNIAKQILCESCGQEVIEIQLECSHRFCIKCAKRRIGESSNWKYLLTDTEIERFKPTCQVCGELYTSQDITTIIKPEREELIRCIDSAEWRACDTCGYKKEAKEYEGDTCKECHAFKIRSGEATKIESSNLEEKGYCHNCKTIRYFVGDYLTSVCCYNHTHCKNCLEKDIAKGYCNTCKTPLSTENYYKINRVLKGKCVVCNEECDREILIPKACCSHDVCSVCQINSELTACMACNKPLSSRSFKKIDEIKQLAN